MTRIKREIGEIGLSSDDEDCDEDQDQSLHDQQMKIELSSTAELTQDSELSMAKGTNSSQGPVLTQDLQPCFLALLRELFLASPTQCLSMDQLDQGVTTWQASPIAALNPWYQVSIDILSVLSP